MSRLVGPRESGIIAAIVQSQPNLSRAVHVGCRFVSKQAKLLNDSDDWKKALALMRKIAMKQLGLTKEHADEIGVPLEREPHSVQCAKQLFEQILL